MAYHMPFKFFVPITPFYGAIEKPVSGLRVTFDLDMKCSVRTTLCKCSLAALTLIVVHSIYIGQNSVDFSSIPCYVHA